jgi:predicted MFS family arabinose efflux permease
MQATVLEVLLCVGVGALIGFILGVNLGSRWGYRHGLLVGLMLLEKAAILMWETLHIHERGREEGDGA